MANTHVLRQGSYLNGFAPRDFAPQFSVLWERCVGAWSPGLGNQGSFLYDQSGHGQNGTLANFTLANAWLTPQFNGLQCSGGTNSVNITSNAMSMAGAFTLMAWINPTSYANFRPIMGRSTSGGVDIGLYFQASGALICESNDTNGGSLSYKSAVAVPTTGVWTHVVVTFVPGSGYTFYFNGKLDSGPGFTSGTASPLATTTSWQIGSLATTAYGSRYFIGGLDDMRVYDYAVPANVVALAALYRGVSYTPRRRMPFGLATTTTSRLLQLRRRAMA